MPHYRCKALNIGTCYRQFATYPLAVQHVFESPQWHQFSPNTILPSQSYLAHIYDTSGKKIN